MDRRPAFGHHHAAARGHDHGQFKVEVGEAAAVHDWRVDIGRLVSISSRLDYRGGGPLPEESGYSESLFRACRS